MIEYFAHRLPRHSQTPARYLRSSGKRVALEGQTRFRRPRLAVERRKVARRSTDVIALAGIPNKVQVGDMGMIEMPRALRDSYW